MPITCNAVGDLLALVEVAIKVVDTLNDARKAPTECRALLNELKALQSLVELSRPMIETPNDDAFRRFVDQRLYAVAQRILDGLALVIDLDIALDPAHTPTSAELSLPRRIKRWARMSRQSLRYALKTNARARECREAISQSFTSLIYALLVSFHADHHQFSETVSAAHGEITANLQRLARTISDDQHRLLQESHAASTAFFNKHRECLEEIQTSIAGVMTQIEKNNRAAVDAITRSHTVVTQNVLKTVANEHAVTRHSLVAAMAREHSDTRRCIAFDATERERAARASSLEHLTTRSYMRALLAEGLEATTTTTIGIVRSENDKTRMQVVESVSGLGLTIVNGMHEDRAHLARMEAKLQSLIERVDTVVDVANMVQHVQAPGFQQLRVGRQLVMKCCAMLADAPVTPTSRDAITGAIVLAFAAQQEHTRLMYAAMAVGLFIWRLVSGLMYQVPTRHMVYVFDFFDSRIAIPLEEVKSSETMHQALARRANTMGLVLIQTRQYEIRIGETAQLLSSAWTDILTAGSEVSLNARVQRNFDETRVICPTCSTSIPVSDPQVAAEGISCPHCPMRFFVSVSIEPDRGSYPPEHDANFSEEIDDAVNENSTDAASGHQASAPEFNLEFVLRHCKRVHFVAQLLLGEIGPYSIPSELTSPHRHEEPVPVANAASASRQSLDIPRPIDQRIPGGDQLTDALVLHNYLSHRGYSLDWTDELISRSRGWRSTAWVDGHVFGVGIAMRKTEARQAAAAYALDYLRSHPTALPSRRARENSASLSSSHEDGSGSAASIRASWPYGNPGPIRRPFGATVKTSAPSRPSSPEGVQLGSLALGPDTDDIW